MAIDNVTRAVSITSTTHYLNMPVTSGISPDGYWFYYVPKNSSNSALAAAIKPYKWNTALTLINSTSTLAMEGTVPLITETWENTSTYYHGSSIEWIGSGVNDITNTEESDAFFFSHLGTLSTSPDDDIFYWDRAYLAVGSSEWDYYQYHKHSPTNYVDFENGRIAMSARGYINPNDKAFGYMISTRVKVAATTYNSVMARIHTPSVGGAHNSHNDITLPATSTKNYLPSGILKGNSNRFHAFYIAANGSQWDVFTRTYTQASVSFSAETNLGTFDLADPTFNPVTSTGTQSQFPIRASCGTLFGSRIYFPVIFNNATTGFDLKIWSLNSLDTIAGGSLLQYTLETGVSVRPDCHLKIFGDKLYAVYTDVTSGGVKLKSFDGTTWSSEGSVLTNTTTNYVRVHGFEQSAVDSKFYILASGTSSGGGTYIGPGLYSFEITGLFTGYPHLDYDSTSSSFINRGALATGYITYNHSDGTFSRYTSSEPFGISQGTSVLNFSIGAPKFFNKKETILGGNEFYYQGIVLRDGRKLLAGRIVGNENNLGTGERGDLFLSIYRDTIEDPHHFAWGGAGDDYITGIYESTFTNKVWMVGYTKSELVPKKDIKVHGFARTIADGSSQVEWVDVVTDSTGNIIVVGNHSDNYILLVKFNPNYEISWQAKISGGAGIDKAYGVSVDSSDNIYISGSTTNSGQGGSDAVLLKLTSTGSLVFARTYGTSATEYAASVAISKKSNTEYVVMPVVWGSTTTFVITNTSGTVVEQNRVSDLVVNRVRNDTSNLNSGRFLFAGNDAGGTAKAKFGVGGILDGTRMIQWVDTFATGSTSSEAYDMGAITVGKYAIGGRDNTSALMLQVNVTEVGGVFTVTKNWADLVSTSTFYALSINSDQEIHAVGYTTSSFVTGQGLDDALIVKFSSTGTVLWKNSFGHDSSERFLGVTGDITGENIISAGWSESHSFGRDAVLFRSWTGGYGTGLYHIDGNVSMHYNYAATTVTNTTSTGTLASITAPTNVSGNLTTATTSGYVLTDLQFMADVYDGSYGANGVFTMFIGSIDLNAVQTYLNSQQHRDNDAAGIELAYTGDIWDFYQIATVGDGTADDGNVFGYDIIESKHGIVYAIGQTSGDIKKTNIGGAGVYDYVLAELNPNTGKIDLYQNGTSYDEETYALTELSDGSIAFTGRTTGDLGSANNGGYDIFLGIYNTATNAFRYYSTGTGLDDKGVNIHDLGNNTLGVVFSTYGSLGGITNLGSEDIGMIKFNYNTNTWGTAYQTGSATGETFEQNGKPSTLIDDGRIVISCFSAGIFADDSITYGSQDICIGVLDPTTGEWNKYQTGSGASDFATSIFSTGEKVLVSGYSRATFADGNTNGVFVEFDILKGVSAISAVN